MGDFTTSVDNLFQCLATLTGFFFFFFSNIQMEFPLLEFLAITLVLSLCTPSKSLTLPPHQPPVLQLKAASRTLPPPPLLLSWLSTSSSLHLPSDIVCSCPQTILVSLLRALSSFFMPFLYISCTNTYSDVFLSALQQLTIQCIPICHQQMTYLNSSLHLPSPSMLPAMCCYIGGRLGSVGDSEDTQLFGLGTPPVPEFRGACRWEGFPAGGGESTKPKMEGSWM